MPSEYGKAIRRCIDSYEDACAALPSTEGGPARTELANLLRVREAAQEAAKFVCGCHSQDDPDWHSHRCFIPALRAALAATKEAPTDATKG